MQHLQRRDRKIQRRAVRTLALSEPGGGRRAPWRSEQSRLGAHEDGRAVHADGVGGPEGHLLEVGAARGEAVGDEAAGPEDDVHADRHDQRGEVEHEEVDLRARQVAVEALRQLDAAVDGADLGRG